MKIWQGKLKLNTWRISLIDYCETIKWIVKSVHWTDFSLPFLKRTFIIWQLQNVIKCVKLSVLLLFLKGDSPGRSEHWDRACSKLPYLYTPELYPDRYLPLLSCHISGKYYVNFEKFTFKLKDKIAINYSNNIKPCSYRNKN